MSPHNKIQDDKDHHYDTNNVRLITKFICDALIIVSCATITYNVIHKLINFFLSCPNSLG